jgi:hypothetical protein
LLGDKVQVIDTASVRQLQTEVLDTLTGSQQIDQLEPRRQRGQLIPTRDVSPVGAPVCIMFD